MARTSTTQLRELSMQISRLLDQFDASGDSFVPVLNAMRNVLIVVDALIVEIERPGPPA